MVTGIVRLLWHPRCNSFCDYVCAYSGNACAQLFLSCYGHCASSLASLVQYFLLSAHQRYVCIILGRCNAMRNLWRFLCAIAVCGLCFISASSNLFLFFLCRLSASNWFMVLSSWLLLARLRRSLLIANLITLLRPCTRKMCRRATRRVLSGLLVRILVPALRILLGRLLL
jgi:hypothetical protein